MNSRQRRKLFEQVAARDGLRCQVCNRVGTHLTLILDHRNNIPNDNQLDNLQLLCRRDNYLKNPRRSKNKYVVDQRELSQPRAASAEFVKNSVSEPLFCHFIDATMREDDRILYEEAINSGAQVAGISPVTAKRYLDKLCSKAGPYQVIYDDLADAKFVELKRGPVNLGPHLIGGPKGPKDEA